jgi:serine/threonine-protein kinase
MSSSVHPTQMLDPAKLVDAAASDAKAGDARGTSAIAELIEGRDSRYDVAVEISKGGMGAVHSVHERPLARTVARKTLLPNLVQEPQFIDLFLREARTMAGLEHPHIVPVHDLGVSDEGVYFTMKLVEGRTLSDWIGSQPKDGSELWHGLLDMIDVVIKVCDALSFAHGKGILHCDIKPSNVMVGTHGQVYLMDWGIAQAMAEAAVPRASAEPREDHAPMMVSVLGTPSYMAPEQAVGASLDQRADVFAVGALLYHLICGRAPYTGPSLQSVMLQAMVGDPTPPLEVRPNIPPALAAIVMKAMARQLDHRYPTVDALRGELVRFVRGEETFERVTFEAGQLITQQGESGRTAFYVETGRCRVTIDGKVIREIGPHEVFGEMAVLAEGKRTATVEALETTVLQKIDGATLLAELDSMKPWMGALIRSLAARSTKSAK